MPKGQRLDLYLLQKGLFASREIAQAAIMDGGIIVDGVKITKPGVSVSLDAQIEITSDWQPKKFVSRGGSKLEKALDHFAVNPTGRICLDIGASTGGFTDCLLSRGAKKVYAIDVGYGQIAWSLRTDERVVVLERTNARHLTQEMLYKPGDPVANLVAIDVSFISLDKILPACLTVVAPNADILALIKPQFEAGKQAVGKGGVVKSSDQHKEILIRVLRDARELNLFARDLTFSPLKGPSGNIEFLVHWVLDKHDDPDIEFVVNDAHKQLN